MLGLAEQVGGAEFRIDAVVGDDQGLGRPGEQIDADAAEQLTLGLGHIGVAGADDHVDRRDGLGAERHGGDRLHAAEHEDLVGAAEMHGSDDRRMRTALERRRAGGNPLHARHPRGHDRHVRRRHHRVAAARHIAADAVHRDVAVPEHDARKRLDLEVVERRLLLLGEIADLRLGEADVVEVALADFRDGALDFLLAQPEILRRPLVEFLRQLPDRLVAALLDGGQDRLDRFADFGVRGLDRARVEAALEMPSHGNSPVIVMLQSE